MDQQLSTNNGPTQQSPVMETGTLQTASNDSVGEGNRPNFNLESTGQSSKKEMKIHDPIRVSEFSPNRGKDRKSTRSTNVTKMSNKTFDSIINGDQSLKKFMSKVLKQHEPKENYVSILDECTPAPNHYAVMQDFVAKKQNVISKYKNGPTYPMFQRTDQGNKSIISPKHTADKVGRDAPPVGLYDTSTYKYNKMSTKKVPNPGLQLFSKEQRFKHNSTTRGAIQKQFQYSGQQQMLSARDEFSLSHLVPTAASMEYPQGSLAKKNQYYIQQNRKMYQDPDSATQRIKNLEPLNLKRRDFDSNEYIMVNDRETGLGHDSWNNIKSPVNTRISKAQRFNYDKDFEVAATQSPGPGTGSVRGVYKSTFSPNQFDLEDPRYLQKQFKIAINDASSQSPSMSRDASQGSIIASPFLQGLSKSRSNQQSNTSLFSQASLKPGQIRDRFVDTKKFYSKETQGQHIQKHSPPSTKYDVHKVNLQNINKKGKNVIKPNYSFSKQLRKNPMDKQLSLRYPGPGDYLGNNTDLGQSLVTSCKGSNFGRAKRNINISQFQGDNMNKYASSYNGQLIINFLE